MKIFEISVLISVSQELLFDFLDSHPAYTTAYESDED